MYLRVTDWPCVIIIACQPRYELRGNQLVPPKEIFFTMGSDKILNGR